MSVVSWNRAVPLFNQAFSVIEDISTPLKKTAAVCAKTVNFLQIHYQQHFLQAAQINNHLQLLASSTAVVATIPLCVKSGRKLYNASTHSTRAYAAYDLAWYFFYVCSNVKKISSIVFNAQNPTVQNPTIAKVVQISCLGKLAIVYDFACHTYRMEKFSCFYKEMRTRCSNIMDKKVFSSKEIREFTKYTEKNKSKILGELRIKTMDQFNKRMQKIASLLSAKDITKNEQMEASQAIKILVRRLQIQLYTKAGLYVVSNAMKVTSVAVAVLVSFDINGSQVAAITLVTAIAELSIYVLGKAMLAKDPFAQDMWHMKVFVYNTPYAPKGGKDQMKDFEK